MRTSGQKTKFSCAAVEPRCEDLNPFARILGTHEASIFFVSFCTTFTNALIQALLRLYSGSIKALLRLCGVALAELNLFTDLLTEILIHV